MNKILLTLIIIVMTFNVVSAIQLDIVNTDPAPLRSGTHADITVIVVATHDEDVKENVELKLIGNEDVLVLGPDTRVINFLRPGDIYSRTYRVFLSENLPSASIPLVFEIREGSTLRTVEKEFFVQRGETLPNIRVGNVQTVPSDIIKDSKSNVIRISLSNLGDRTAELIRGRLIGSDIRETSAFTLQDTLAELRRGQTGVLEFTFDLNDIKEEKTTLNLILDYQIEDVHGNFRSSTETLTFDLTLKQTPDIVIVSQEKLNSVLVGRSSNEIKITLENQGLEEAENVRLRLFPDVSYPFDFIKTNYFVSSLMKEGEQASIIIEFDVLNSGTVRNYPINIEIESSVGTARYTQRDRIDIEVTGESMDMGTMIRNVVLIVSFLIAIYFGYRTYKQNKKKPSPKK